MESALSSMEERLKDETANLAPIPGEEVAQPVQADIAPLFPEFSSPSVPVSGDPGFIGPVSPLVPGDPGFIGPVKPDPYGAPDSEVREALQDVATALNVLEKLLQLAYGLTDAELRADFEREVREAQRKLIEGQRQMMDASQKIADASNGLYGANDQINALASQLSSVQNQMGLELASISGIASTIAGLDSRISSTTQQLADANARYNQALNRANYPAGSTGLTQQRNDLRAINNDIFNLNTSILDLENTRGQEIFNMNQAGDRYNNLLPQEQAIRSGVRSAYDMAGSFEAQRNAGIAQANTASGFMRDGYNQYLGAGQAYQNARDNILMPLAQSRIGASGASQAINQISQGNYFSAGAEVMRAGWNLGMMNPANASLVPFSGLVQGTFQSVGNSVDAEIRRAGGVENVDFGRLMLNATIDSGNRFLAVKDFQRATVAIGDTVELAQAGDGRGATLIATTQAIPALISGVSTVAQTASPFLGPIGAGMAPAIPPARDAINALQSGAINTAYRVYEADWSRTPSPSTPRKIGRGLIEYQTVSGQAESGVSKISVGGFGAVSTAVNAAEGAVTSYFRNNREIASDTANRIDAIGRNPANWPPAMPPGTFQPGTAVGGP